MKKNVDQYITHFPEKKKRWHRRNLLEKKALFQSVVGAVMPRTAGTVLRGSEVSANKLSICQSQSQQRRKRGRERDRGRGKIWYYSDTATNCCDSESESQRLHKGDCRLCSIFEKLDTGDITRGYLSDFTQLPLQTVKASH